MSGEDAPPGPGVPRAPSSFTSAQELDEFADRLVQRRHAGRSAKNAATDRWKKLKTAIAFSSRIQPSARPEAATDLLGESLAMYGAMGTEDARPGHGSGDQGEAGGSGLGGMGGVGAASEGSAQWKHKKPAPLESVLAAAIANVDAEAASRLGEAAEQGPGGLPAAHHPGAQHQRSSRQSQAEHKSLQEQDSFEQKFQEAGLGGDGPREVPTAGGDGVTPIVYRDRNNTAQAQDKPDPSGDGSNAGNSSSADRNAAGEGAQEKVDSIKASNFKPRGRRGVESLRVSYDMKLYCWLSDFYVTCLKMPPLHFFLGVFAAPLMLSLLFTPLFLLGASGLQFEDGVLHRVAAAGTATGGASAVTEGVAALTGAPAAAFRVLGILKWAASVLLNVFLYSVSLSTTFGGSPVSARSPYTLLLSNANTLLAQFLFVFLSGAVFARMSQPAHPVRCSKKAIIRNDDFVPTPSFSAASSSADSPRTPGSSASGEQYRILATRLVLTGPPPCELVDVKLRMTFRCFMRQQPSGSVFCSTNDLTLVRSEAAYLRYGMAVRHIIDPSSPLYGHTLESLLCGDACFALTLIGMERWSMQPVFHLQEYFVYDGDVVWGGDYMDFVSVSSNGDKVLDHAKVDLIKTFKAGAIATQAISRMSHAAKHTKEDASPPKEAHSPRTELVTRAHSPFFLSTFSEMLDSLRKLASLGQAIFKPGSVSGQSSQDTHDHCEQRGAETNSWFKASNKLASLHEKKEM